MLGAMRKTQRQSRQVIADAASQVLVLISTLAVDLEQLDIKQQSGLKDVESAWEE